MIDMRALCVVCGVDMWPCMATKRYCSDRCYDAEAWQLEREAKHEEVADRKCKKCAKPIPVTKKRGAIYCSQKCWPRLYSETRDCRTCGKTFRVPGRDQKYCSRHCYFSALRAKGHTTRARSAGPSGDIT